MHQDGLDFLGQRHPAFIPNTVTHHFQRALILKEIYDTVCFHHAYLISLV